ncbi:LLM class flavin-dependent oxidoreductase [Nonomuraea roseola]|uniref:LLM class flavin-dependent oxidoreductase n=1 Tax=Nonomuraea roseola TaxID=46179 RepID=A0ABV5Q6M8_9ACTN
MDLGVALPTSGAYASAEAIVRVAQGAERLGYGAVWTYERLLYPTGGATAGGRPQPLPDFYASTFEPIETLSHVAACTDRVRLGTSVVDAVFHSPVVLARRFATLDRFSGGRAIAGLGLGWMDQEFEAVGVSQRARGEALEEAVGLDHVLFADTASTTADELLRRLSELREAVPSAEWGPAA